MDTEYTAEKIKLSDSWKNKFTVFQKLGGSERSFHDMTSSPEYKALTSKERRIITFNFWAFFFSSLYYFSKKMWAKGAIIMGCGFLWAAILTIIETVLKIAPLPNPVYWTPSAVFCGMMANYDYFRMVYTGEKMWTRLPAFLGTFLGAAGFILLAFIMVILAASQQTIPVS